MCVVTPAWAVKVLNKTVVQTVRKVYISASPATSLVRSQVPSLPVGATTVVAEVLVCSARSRTGIAEKKVVGTRSS